jgi:hypothetical protein
MRKLMFSCLACLALTIALAPSALAQSFEACQLRSTARFSPGLSTSSQAFNYYFSGELQGCRSSEQPGFGDQSGNIEAGQPVNEQVVNSTTGLTDTVTYVEPVPTGSGSCAASTTSGSALASWADGTFTVISYSTTGAVLSGEVVPSMTLTAANAQPGDPTTFTIMTNRFAGDTVRGLVKVQPEPATACTTAAGATTAEFNGEVVIGSS